MNNKMIKINFPIDKFEFVSLTINTKNVDGNVDVDVDVDVDGDGDGDGNRIE